MMSLKSTAKKKKKEKVLKQSSLHVSIWQAQISPFLIQTMFGMKFQDENFIQRFLLFKGPLQNILKTSRLVSYK